MKTQKDEVARHAKNGFVLTIQKIQLMRIIEIISFIFIAIVLKCGVSNAENIRNNTTLKNIVIQYNDSIEIDLYKTVTDSFPYEKYTVKEIYKGEIAKLDLAHFEELPKDIIEDIQIKYNNQKYPNFAGHYIIISWGCGSPCQMNAIIDAKTGKTIKFINTSSGLDFMTDSYLLIINPPADTRFDKDFRDLIGPPKFKVLKNNKVIDLN